MSWAFGLRSGRWYLHQSWAWSAMDRGPQMLEGVAPLGGQVPLKPTAAPEETTIASSGAETPSGPEAAVALVERLNKAYNAGDISSSDVTALLDELVLVDSSGDLWAPGFQSRRWYRLAEAQWRVAEGTPGAGAGREGRAPPLEAAQALGRLEASVSRFPEPIAPAWSPPPGYPERLACPYCGGGLTTTSELCPFCGTSVPLLATGTADDGMPATTGPATLPAAAPDPSTWRLAIIEGAEAGQVFTLKDGLRIGRASENEIRLTDPRSSGRQARIETAGGFPHCRSWEHEWDVPEPSSADSTRGADERRPSWGWRHHPRGPSAITLPALWRAYLPYRCLLWRVRQAARGGDVTGAFKASCLCRRVFSAGCAGPRDCRFAAPSTARMDLGRSRLRSGLCSRGGSGSLSHRSCTSARVVIPGREQGRPRGDINCLHSI